MRDVTTNALMQAKVATEDYNQKSLPVGLAGCVGTYKPTPTLNVHFNFHGPQLHEGMKALKALVVRLEEEIAERFERQCSGEYRTYSYRYEVPGRDQAYTVSA